MKRACTVSGAVLGLALLMGCGNSGNNDCPRKDKGCGKKCLTSIEASVAPQKEVAQEDAPVVENVTPSN